MTTTAVAAPHGEVRIDAAPGARPGGRPGPPLDPRHAPPAAGVAARARLFPMFIAAVNTSTMGAAIDFLPGFEGVDSLLQFLLPASITQSVLFGGLTAGSDTATDIQTGFFDRLLASPVARTSILVGRLTGASVTGAFQALVFIVVYGLFGVRIAGGVPGRAGAGRSTPWCWPS